MEPIWCVAANVRPEAYGRATSLGTKHFTAGALVWMVSWDGFDRARVVGRHRQSKRFIALYEVAERFTNFRAKPAYHAAVCDKLRAHVLAWRDLQACKDAAEWFNAKFLPIEDLRGEIARKQYALHMFEHDERTRELKRQATTALSAWTIQQRQADRTPPVEVSVLADWLEQAGAPIARDELVRTLDRRRQL